MSKCSRLVRSRAVASGAFWLSAVALGFVECSMIGCSAKDEKDDMSGLGTSAGSTSVAPTGTLVAPTGSSTTPASSGPATTTNGATGTSVVPTTTTAPTSTGATGTTTGNTTSSGASATSGASGNGSALDSTTMPSTTSTGDTSSSPPAGDIPGVGMSKGACTIGAGQQMGEGQTMEQYYGADVTRDGKNYKMITNGWGMNWDSHDISWLGSSMAINTYAGDRQDNGAPAGYPSVFCGRYSDRSLDCGLPMAASAVTALNTAVSWSHPMGDGTYNVAYDVWFGDASAMGRGGLQSYFMVWLKDPEGESPAGSLREEGVTVPNAPGVWNIIDGEVNGLPIVNYVRAEGDELQFMAFDIMDFVRDARTRNLEFPGDDLLAIAIGFEIWQGPVTGLRLEDFCLDIQ